MSIKKLTQHWYPSLALWFTRAWFQGSPWLYFLWPLGKLYEGVSYLRYQVYKKSAKPGKHRAPIVIVGNLSVGGNGKTPCVMALTHFLRARGYTPGIVSRGYGGHANHYPCLVTPSTSVREVGDEALLMYQELNSPVVVDPNRSRAVDFLLQQFPAVNIVLSDDGLQHYSLARDYEIVVVDALRGFGNQWCLPAGPLREPIRRLKTVDLILAQGENKNWPHSFILQPQAFVNIKNPAIRHPVDISFSQPVHAVAGIGNPERFFASLRLLGLTVIPHPFPDHYWLKPSDLDYNDDYPVIMTAKDAVKCQDFVQENAWYLQVTAVLNERAESILSDVFKGPRFKWNVRPHDE